jgi:hypothetical protein
VSRRGGYRLAIVLAIGIASLQPVVSLAAGAIGASSVQPAGPTPAPTAAAGYQGTFTYHNDNLRTGQNLFETTLTPANVNSDTFGRLFAYGVDGQVYAEPLYVPAVNVPGKGVHNVVYVATENDSVYALDADQALPPLWYVSFLDAAENVTPVSSQAVNSGDITPEIGITSTPVIDPATGTLYVVAKTMQGNGACEQRLHALDIATGAEKFGGPVLIRASTGANEGNVVWQPLIQNQRSALLLAGGVVYVAFASHGDQGAYHGWVLAYDAATLAILAVYVDTPKGLRGGIWQTGNGPAADSDGNIFVLTGNGSFDGNTAGSDLGDSALKLQLISNAPNAGFSLVQLDSFTPFNQAVLDAKDFDFGTGGAFLPPDQSSGPPHLLITGGKGGGIYVLNRDNLGGFQSSSNSQIVQYLPNATGALYGTPAYWQGTVYVAPIGDTVKAFQLSGGQLSSAPTSRSVRVLGYPAAAPVISANGSSDGVLWVLDNTGAGQGQTAVLCAYDATNLATLLYESDQSGPRDTAAPGVKFSVPTVANGKVYVPGAEQLTVYGLLAAAAPTSTPAPTPTAAAPTASPTATPLPTRVQAIVGGKLILSSNAIGFGQVSIDTNPTTRSLVISNRGREQLTGGVDFSRLGPPFSGNGSQSFSLDSGQTTNVAVTFTPPQSPGHFSGRITISSSDPALPTVTVPVTAHAVAGNLVVPKSLDFGKIFVGTIRKMTLRIKNSGPGVLHGSVGAGAGLFGALSGSGAFSLEDGQAQDVLLQFAPIGQGAFRAVVTVTSDQPGHASTPVMLLGIAQ